MTAIVLKKFMLVENLRMTRRPVVASLTNLLKLKREALDVRRFTNLTDNVDSFTGTITNESAYNAEIDAINVDATECGDLLAYYNTEKETCPLTLQLCELIHREAH